MSYKNIVLTIIVFLTLATIHLYIYTKMMAVVYNSENTERELSSTRSENRYLENRLAREQSLDKIEKIAREKFGMGQPTDIKFISLESEPVFRK